MMSKTRRKCKARASTFAERLCQSITVSHTTSMLACDFWQRSHRSNLECGVERSSAQGCCAPLLRTRCRHRAVVHSAPGEAVLFISSQSLCRLWTGPTNTICRPSAFKRRSVPHTQLSSMLNARSRRIGHWAVGASGGLNTSCEPSEFLSIRYVCLEGSVSPTSSVLYNVTV